MDSKEALELAIDALEKDRMYFTFASDSEYSDKYRARLVKAIEVLTGVEEEIKILQNQIREAQLFVTDSHSSKIRNVTPLQALKEISSYYEELLDEEKENV